MRPGVVEMLKKKLIGLQSGAPIAAPSIKRRPLCGRRFHLMSQHCKTHPPIHTCYCLLPPRPNAPHQPQNLHAPGVLMRNSTPLAAVRSAVVSTFANKFIRRFAIAALLAGFDGSVLVTSGSAVFDAVHEAPLLALAFVFAAFGLFLTLGRIWFLTFRKARVD